MAENQLQKLQNNSLSNTLIKEKFNALPKEQQNQLTEFALEKRLELEHKITESSIDTRNADIAYQRHMEALSQAQREHYEKGSSVVSSDIKTEAGHMRIESKTGGMRNVGCLLPVIIICCITLLLF